MTHGTYWSLWHQTTLIPRIIIMLSIIAICENRAHLILGVPIYPVLADRPYLPDLYHRCINAMIHAGVMWNSRSAFCLTFFMAAGFPFPERPIQYLHTLSFPVQPLCSGGHEWAQLTDIRNDSLTVQLCLYYMMLYACKIMVKGRF